MITLHELFTYPMLYRAAKWHVKEQGMQLMEGDKTELSCAFTWSETPEGQKFWNAVNDRKWTEAVRMFPNLFDAEVHTSAITSITARHKLKAQNVKREHIAVTINTPKHTLSGKKVQLAIMDDVGFEPPKEPVKKQLSFLPNDKQRRDAKEVSDKIFRKRYKH